ncbi:uncharacterized protein LOC135620092 isoform X4 [Musa acuminata AAA Group]|uniref:uncharacterized protein LOC135620092 isoform X4 n=1 Tax=Musa acuminata AAA Group TaxID=214697 RepID=UPI0031D65D6F
MATCCCCSAPHRPSAFLGSPLRHPGNPLCRKGSLVMVSTFKVTALFWGPRRIKEPRELNPSLGAYKLLKSSSEGVSVDDKTPREISLSVVSSISDISSNDWDACATDATSPEKFNPFISHAFLSSLEESRSAIKLRISSLHITFPSENEWHKLKQSGFLPRIGIQYHWKNRNYKNFDDFLMDMKQSKRKNIRQERKKVLTHNLKMKRLFGDEIKAKHWDSFYKFYRNTTDNKWGSAYLTRDFFHILGSKMGDHILLIAAEDEGELVAGALNLIGGDTLFGRLWGCLPHVYFPNLHFEACYYQAIEAAIDLNLTKVEAGAQGEHKIQRGYLPVTTFSCHYILDDDFRKVIDNFLVYETEQVNHVMQLLHESGPFKEGII